MIYFDSCDFLGAFYSPMYILYLNAFIFIFRYFSFLFSKCAKVFRVIYLFAKREGTILEPFCSNMEVFRKAKNTEILFLAPGEWATTRNNQDFYFEF